MIRKCVSSPYCDVGKVITGLGVSLDTVYSKRQIPSRSVEVVYNQISELSDIGYRVNDDFDLMMIARNSAGLSSNSGTGSSQNDGSHDVSPAAPSV